MARRNKKYIVSILFAVIVAATAVLLIVTTVSSETASPNDTFDGTVVNTCKWEVSSVNGATVNQDGRLILSVSGDFPTSSALVITQYEFPSDFDVQVDFEIGEGWSNPISGHLDGAIMGVSIGDKRYHMTRIRFPLGSPWPPHAEEDQLWIWQNFSPYDIAHINMTATSGKYRILRIGSTLYFKYDIGSGWQDLGSVDASSLPAKIYLNVNSIDASHAFTSYFDNFVINSGLTTFSPCPEARPEPTVDMVIKKVEIDMKTGNFEIKGTINVNDTDFANLVFDPQSRLLLELQTGGTSEEPEFGIVGEDQVQLTTDDDWEELKFEAEEEE